MESNKLKFKIILIILLGLLSPNLLIAQVIDSTAFRRLENAAKLSTFVFEGTITEQTYFEESPGNAYTASRINITKIFKGLESLVCGSVMLIQYGTGGHEVDFGNGAYSIPTASHTFHFREGATGVFFTKKNEGRYAEPGINTATNSQFFLRNVYEELGTFIGYQYDAQYLDTIEWETVNDFAHGFLGVEFNNYDELQDYLRENYGIDTSNFITCQQQPKSGSKRKENFDNPEKFDDKVQPNSPPVQPEEKNKILEEYEKSIEERQKSIKKKTGKRTVSLNYGFANEKFTGASPRYFEFDIMVHSSQFGTYLDNAAVRVSYNTDAFGSNVVSNNKITVTKGSAFNSSTYLNPQSLLSDDASNKFIDALGVDWQQSSVNRTEVSTSPMQLLHVKIEINNCHKETDLALADNFNVQIAAWYTDNATEPVTGGDIYNYYQVQYGNDLDVVLCQPIITNFTSTVRAGVGDILTIQGKYFGSSRGSGQIWLKNADDGGKNWIKKQDDADYVNMGWTDTEIKLKVPSVVEAVLINGEYPHPGSGLFKIVTDLGDEVTSTQPVTIKYAIVNNNVTTSLPDKQRLSMVSTNSNGGYTFRCDTSISNYPIRKAIVEKAIHDWNCRTGANWEVGSDIALHGSKEDGINVISFDPNLKGAPAAFTQRHRGGACNTSAGTGYKAFYKEVDIVFSINFDEKNPNLSWFFDTSYNSVPANKIDFYGTLLHELGHAHAILHVNDPSDFMYYLTVIGPTSPIFRNFNPARWGNTVDAGNDVVDYSSSLDFTNCTTSELIPAIPADCSLIGGIKGRNNMIGFAMYPNPAENYIYFELRSNERSSLRITDITGKEVLFQMLGSIAVPTTFTLDISSLNPGVYMFSIQGSNNFSGKIIKK